MKARLFRILLTLGLLAAAPAAFAQTYTQTPVTVSKEKVRANGKVYWSHVVQERQTLFSIARAYGVTVDEICAANPDQALREQGPKVNAILLIPVPTGEPRQESPAASSSEPEPETASAPADTTYFIHTVKWYENIDDIARKYGMPADVILEYNGLASRKLKTRMKLRIPKEIHQAAPTAPVAVTDEAPADTTATAPADSTDGHSRLEDLISLFKKKEQVKAVLILPFGAGGTPVESNMDFYAGFLMGIKDLGEDGISTDLSVYDFSSGNLPVTADKLRESDIVIGPLAPADIRKVMSVNTSNTPIVSPLDPRSAALAADHPQLIHAPTSSDIQYEEAVRWIREDLAPADQVVILYEKGVNSEAMLLADSLLTQAQVSHRLFSYSILEGRRVTDDLQRLASEEGTTRVLITSDNEAFVHDAVRNLNLVNIRNKNIVLYGAAKIRTFGRIEVENLHKLQFHAALSYHIDYDDPRVQRFILAYRALYQTEPTQFAFQGYDIASFFLRNCYEGGNRWLQRMTAAPRARMLQTDFMLAQVEEGGLVNTAIRRVVYTPDYRITLIR